MHERLRYACASAHIILGMQRPEEQASLQNPVFEGRSSRNSCSTSILVSQQLGRLNLSGRKFSKYKPLIEAFPHIPKVARPRPAERFIAAVSVGRVAFTAPEGRRGRARGTRVAGECMWCGAGVGTLNRFLANRPR